jgi:peptide/nickel transport system substrate-binding protein
MQKQLFWSISAFSLILVSCGGGNKEAAGGHPEAKGNAAYGGTFHTAENDKYSTLFPLDVIDVPSWHVTTQMHDGLLKFNSKTLQLEPAVAEKYEVSGNKREYTFTIRKGVFFHDDECFGGKGREVNANDVKYTLELLATPGVADENFKSMMSDKITGADEFYAKKAQEISGVKVIDDHTIRITMKQPAASNLYFFASPITSIIAKEAYDKYGKDMKVGCGPFILIKKGEPDKDLYLVRNAQYYLKDKDGNQLPFLDTVHFAFIDDNNAQLEFFRKGKLSMLYGLPAEKISEVVQENMPDFTGKPPKYLLDRQSEMVTQFYELNLTRPQFKDVRVRKALSMAINRAKINELILNGQAAITGPNGLTGNYGIVPPISQFKGYDTSLTRGYNYNPEMAKKLMAEAGYPNGNNFETINLVINSGGSRHSKVANEVANQWRNVLGINVEISTLPLDQKIEDSKYGRGDIFRSAWVADYPSPESFLSIFYGANVPESLDQPSHPNTMRYRSAAFDTLFVKGMHAENEADKMKYFAQAEQQMLQDCPIIVLWYGENYKLLHSNVNNFYNNAMNYINLVDVYIKAPAAPEKKEK